MSTCRRVMRCRPQDVFDVLSDGWTYGMWVVGAARIRGVDPAWPEAGSRIHHSVGVWPAMLHDTTHSESAEPPRRLRLRARAWPTGEARVEIVVDPHDQGCVVAMTESTTSLPARLLPGFVEAPLLNLRNAETLRRLAFIAEGRARSGSPAR